MNGRWRFIDGNVHNARFKKSGKRVSKIRPNMPAVIKFFIFSLFAARKKDKTYSRVRMDPRMETRMEKFSKFSMLKAFRLNGIDPRTVSTLLVSRDYADRSINSVTFRRRWNYHAAFYKKKKKEKEGKYITRLWQVIFKPRQWALHLWIRIEFDTEMNWILNIFNIFNTRLLRLFYACFFFFL